MARLNTQALTRPQLATLQNWLNERDSARPANHPASYHNRLNGTINADARRYAAVMALSLENHDRLASR